MNITISNSINSNEFEKLNDSDRGFINKIILESLEDKKSLLASFGVEIISIEVVAKRVSKEKKYERKLDEYLLKGTKERYVSRDLIEKNNFPNKHNPFFIILLDNITNYERYREVNVDDKFLDIINYPESFSDEIIEFIPELGETLELPDEDFEYFCLDDKIEMMFYINQKLGEFYKEFIDYVLKVNVKSFKYDW